MNVSIVKRGILNCNCFKEQLRCLIQQYTSCRSGIIFVSASFFEEVSVNNLPIDTENNLS